MIHALNNVQECEPQDIAIEVLALRTTSYMLLVKFKGLDGSKYALQVMRNLGVIYLDFKISILDQAIIYYYYYYT